MGGRLYGLDALRGVAAIAVAVHHLARTYHLPALPLNPAIAVDLFFILSGFVMTRTYEDRLRRGASLALPAARHGRHGRLPADGLHGRLRRVSLAVRLHPA